MVFGGQNPLLSHNLIFRKLEISEKCGRAYVEYSTHAQASNKRCSYVHNEYFLIRL